MKRATHTPPDFVGKARTAWGAEPPDWVLALAEQCAATNQKQAAKRIGLSDGLVSQVLGNKYPGDVARVAEKVRGALMGVTVTCPVLGDIGRDRCLDEQKKTFTGTSSVRSRLYRACRSGCPHSLLKPEHP